MSTPVRCLVVIVCSVSILGASEPVQAQADPQNFMFSSGQTVQPFFEGWAHNPDGSYEMHFGYFNRNYVEETHVPIGPDNRMTPDASDQGQPTLFYPHVNHRVFSVTIPADWGNKELIWQVTVRNETYRAVGWLQAEWEIEGARPRPLLRCDRGNHGEPGAHAGGRIRPNGHAARHADDDRHGER